MGKFSAGTTSQNEESEVRSEEMNMKRQIPPYHLKESTIRSEGVNLNTVKKIKKKNKNTPTKN